MINPKGRSTLDELKKYNLSCMSQKRMFSMENFKTI